MHRLAATLRARVLAIPPLAQDAALYLASGAFAGATALASKTADYRQWGTMAFGFYLGVGVVLAGLYLRGRRRPLAGRTVSYARRAGVVVLLFGAVLVPLVVQITWRAESLPGAHAQPEVVGIERAADRIVDHKDVYLAKPTSAGVPARSDAHSVDARTFFPYLPAMALFGLVNAIRGPLELTDARVSLTLFTLLVVALALSYSRASPARRGQALQWLIVLPSGALPMVTGGDDLPVLALMLAGLVALRRRRPLLAGLLLGLGGSLKFTAWPLLLLAVLVVRDRRGDRARVLYAVAAAVVVIPSIALGFASGPSAFITNVVRFPLGLTGIHSPAASPLLGQALTAVFPEARHLVTAGLGLLGVALCWWLWCRMRPATPGAIARYCAAAMVIATVLAPATRFGYLIYPANLVIWSYMIDAMAPALAQDSSSTSSSRITNELVGVGLPPASAALSEPLA